MTTIGSLCSGYGGLDMGAQAVFGGETVWVSDIDKGANKILAYRYPDVPNLGDFTKVDWTAVTPVEVLTAGFPCQPVSHAGKRLGDNDERWLWDDVARAVGELRPGVVVLENVRGLLTAGSGRLFGRVLGALAALGYDARWHGLRAADIGAPHGRWRVFIVATDARGEAREQWAGLRTDDTPRDGRGQSPRGRGSADLTLLGTSTSRDWKDGGPQEKVPVNGLLGRQVWALLPTPAVNDMGAGKTPDDWDAWTDRMKAEHGNGNGHGKSLSIEAQRLLPTPKASVFDAKTSERAKNPYSSKDSMADIIENSQWGDYAAAIARWENILGRPAPAPTMTSTKGNPQLSPRFVEWMMGLPEGWVTDVPGITRNEALKALGNGVVPQQAAEALRVMLSWEAVA